MYITKKIFEDCIIQKNYSKYLFRFGILLLPSASIISALLILISIAKPIQKNFHKFFVDKWNVGFLISIPLLFLSCFVQYIDPNNINGISSSILGLFNWIPYFFCFIGFQHYLSSKEDRALISTLLIVGTIPVIFSGFTQYFFNWYGPFETLNGLIIWYQRKGTGFTGLFNNTNYLACWLSVVLPLTISQYVTYKKVFFKSCFLFYFTIIISISIILTQSIDSIFAFLIIFLIFFFNNIVINKFVIIITSSFLIFMSNTFLINYLKSIILSFFKILNFDLIYTKLLIRLNIFSQGLDLISKKPIFGYGPGNFSSKLNELLPELSFNINHSHNLFHELALNYGIIACLLIAIPIILLFYKSYLKILNLGISQYKFSNDILSLQDKSWFVAFFIILISQMVDIQYYDVRISLLFWLLLAGLREIIKE